jgi:transcriptional regulator with XRE-family HTH domain
MMMGPMQFREKLRNLAADQNKAKAGRAVGLGDTTISTYIAKGSIPRADIAFKISKAFNVPTDWLLDDSQEWPPPERILLADVDDNRLMREVCRRARLDAIDVRELVDRAGQINWAEVSSRISGVPAGDRIPDELCAEVSLAFSLEFAPTMLQKHEASAQTVNYLPMLPRADEPRERYDFHVLAREIARIMALPGYADVKRQLENLPGADSIFAFQFNETFHPLKTSTNPQTGSPLRGVKRKGKHATIAGSGSQTKKPNRRAAGGRKSSAT